MQERSIESARESEVFPVITVVHNDFAVLKNYVYTRKPTKWKVYPPETGCYSMRVEHNATC